MPPVSLWVNSWTKGTDWKHAEQIPYVDSYIQWKAELFIAYQKELTHDICVDLKPAAEMKSKQYTGLVEDEEKISSYRCSVAFMNESFSKQPKKTKILGYKDALFRV